MRAAHRLRDGDWAKEIIALSTKNDPKKGVNPTTLQFAVELLAETGRMEEARALLKVRLSIAGSDYKRVVRVVLAYFVGSQCRACKGFQGPGASVVFALL